MHRGELRREKPTSMMDQITKRMMYLITSNLQHLTLSKVSFSRKEGGQLQGSLNPSTAKSIKKVMKRMEVTTQNTTTRQVKITLISSNKVHRPPKVVTKLTHHSNKVHLMVRA